MELVESVFLVGISPARDARRAQASPGLDGQVEARSMIFEGQIGGDVRGVGRIPGDVRPEEHGREPHRLDLYAAKRRT
jgi:hypothetical protein